MPDKFIIDPDAKLDYSVDWTDWLNGVDVIDTSTWAITPTGPTLSAPTHDDTGTIVWVDGCTVDTTYRLTNSIVTDDGREDDRTITLHCEQR